MNDQLAVLDGSKRKEVFDYLRLSGHNWWGDIGDVEFLKRLWNLESIASHDGRFPNAEGDVFQHRVMNLDWEDDWVFSDSRFDLAGCEESRFLAFLCETVHPVVRNSDEQAKDMVRSFNEILAGTGWRIAEGKKVAGRQTWSPNRVTLPASSSDDPMGELARRGFRIGERLGSGASGTVFRATQTSLDRSVAVKIFSGGDNSKLRARFIHEARMLARLQHPNIPYLLTSGGDAHTPYIVLQHVDGESIRQRLDRVGAVSNRDACRVALEVLEALACAHDMSIVHRDVKPENILIDSAENVYLIDFSISASLKPVAGLTRLTDHENVPGTMLYSAPEILSNDEWDHRVDIYGLGAVLFEMLTGRKWANADARAEAGLDERFAGIVRRACAKSPGERFSSANDFAASLRRAAVPRVARDNSATAVCLNLACPSANWNPYFFPTRLATQDIHCRECGSQLRDACDRCSRPYDGNGRFCASCGHEIYTLPKCVECGESLKRSELAGGTCAECDITF